jgi:hypothetical protein
MDLEQLGKTVDLMQKYGGGFVRSLADCVCKADLGNQARLIGAFPEIFEEYGPTGIFWEANRISGS